LSTGIQAERGDGKTCWTLPPSAARRSAGWGNLPSLPGRRRVVAVKLRKPIDLPVENGVGSEAARTIPLRPLDISGVLISKPALIEALRVYVPNLADVDQLEDGRFLLTLAREGQGGDEGSPAR